MPDYKKRKRNRILNSSPAPKRKRVKSEPEENIEMAPSKRREKPNKNMKVVKGRKLENKRRFKLWSYVTAIIVLAVLLFEAILPAGIIGTVSTYTALLGTGSYPIELESTATINAVSKDSYYYVLSSTHINAFSNSGKKLLSYAHGFENPVLKTSASRALVFNQGSTEALIFDLRDLRTTINSKKPIINAAISNSGSYALVTDSDKYTAAVTVYKKNGEEAFEWYSAEDLVNHIALSPNGKKLAVSTVNSSGGQLRSKLSVLNFKSAKPEFSEEFENSVYTIDTSYRSAFVVVTSNSVEFIKWRSFKSKKYDSDFGTAFFKPVSGGFVAVYNRDSNKTDNHIAVFSRTGKLKSEFRFKEIISDIAMQGGHIYCMNDTEIKMLSSKGELLRKATCGFGAERLCVTSTNTVAVITDNKIEKVSLSNNQSEQE